MASYEQGGPVRVLDRPASPALQVERAFAHLGAAGLGPRLRARRDRWRLGDWVDAPAVYVNTVAGPTLRVLDLVAPTATVVVHVHEMEAALRYGIDDRGRRLLRERPDHYIAASQAVADNLTANHDIGPDRVVVHHEFVEPVTPTGADERRSQRRRLGLPEDAFIVGGSGMTEWRKAPELFVRLAADLRARTERPLAFVWVGGSDHGPEWAPLDHEAHHLGVADVVRFVGTQERAGDWFRLFDVFALTSREDAFPLAALEAASAGTPVVTFDTGGMVEFVGDEGEHGAVVPYPDTAAMAEVLAGYAADDAGRRTVGEAAAAAVRARHVTDVAAPALWADLSAWVRG